MKLSTMLNPEFVKMDIMASSTAELLQKMIHCIKERNGISDETTILRKLIEREKLGSTAIGNHSAVPHTKLKGIKEPIIFIAVSKKGVVFNEKDDEIVHLIILILSPNDSPITHLQILASAASLIKKSDKLVKDLLNSQSPENLIEIIKKYEVLDE